MRVAGLAVRDNLTRLGPKVLPLAELARYAINLGARHLLKRDVPAYLPDFNLAFDHFCIHTGEMLDTSHDLPHHLVIFWTRDTACDVPHKGKGDPKEMLPGKALTAICCVRLYTLLLQA